MKKVSSSLWAAWYVGPIIAPAIGAALQTYFNWQANFYFLMAYGLIILIFSWKQLPETNQQLAPLNFSETKKNYQKILLCKEFVGSACCLAIGYSLIVVFNIMGPFLLQVDIGLTVLQYGYTALILGFGGFIGSLASRFIVLKFNPDKIIIVWCTVAIGTAMLLVLLSILGIFNVFSLVLPTFVILLSVGFIYPNCSLKCLRRFPEMAGSASAVMGVLTMLGTSLISGVASILNTGTLASISTIYLVLCLLLAFIFMTCVKEKNTSLFVIRKSSPDTYE